MTLVRWDDVRREPFRVLFPLGAAAGCVGVGHWLLYSLHVTSSASVTYHGAVQIGAFMSCFILGFLWTSVPRMTGVPPAATSELAAAAALIVGQVILPVWRPALAPLCFLGMLLLLAAFAGRRFVRGGPAGKAPPEFVWIPIAILFGTAGSMAATAAAFVPVPEWLATSARVMWQQGFTLAIVAGVGGFMAPRLMGRTDPPAVRGPIPEPQRVAMRRRKMGRHLASAVLLIVSFLMEGAGQARAAYAVRALVVTVELGHAARWWNVRAPADLYARLLLLSLRLLIAGLWAVALWPRYRIALLHIVFIGGFSLMIFAVGSVVVLSHAGEGQALRRPLAMFWAVGGLMGCAAIARVAADLSPSHRFVWIGVAASAWIAGTVSWLGVLLPRMLRPVRPGAFEQVHRKAKQDMSPVTP